MNFHIPPAVLKAVLLHTPATDVRYYLNGVFVQKLLDGVLLVATNGDTMIVHHEVCEVAGDEPVGFSVIVPRTLLASVKTVRDLGVRIEITADPLSTRPAAVTAQSFDKAGGFVTLGEDALHGTYPTWSRVVPDRASGEVAHFNPESILAAKKSIRLIGGHKDGYRAVLQPNGSSNALVSSIDVPDTLVVVAPVVNNTLAPSIAGKLLRSIHAGLGQTGVDPS